MASKNDSSNVKQLPVAEPPRMILDEAAIDAARVIPSS